MLTPTEVVTNFCDVFPEDGGRTAVRRFFTPETVWTNVGISSTTGIEEAIGMIDQLEQTMDISTVRFELHAIAAQGSQVLTERLDIFYRADGMEIGRVMLMGIFEIDGDKITAWRDYADMPAVAQLGT
ncbi:limonene-1,2-epoxide hydrolase family protein [Agrobacterium salinitolerans]